MYTDILVYSDNTDDGLLVNWEASVYEALTGYWAI